MKFFLFLFSSFLFFVFTNNLFCGEWKALVQVRVLGPVTDARSLKKSIENKLKDYSGLSFCSDDQLPDYVVEVNLGTGERDSSLVVLENLRYFFFGFKEPSDNFEGMGRRKRDEMTIEAFDGAYRHPWVWVLGEKEEGKLTAKIVDLVETQIFDKDKSGDEQFHKQSIEKKNENS